MGLLSRALVAGTAGVSAAVIVGCGSGSLLSNGQAGALDSQLNRIQQALGNGACRQAASEEAALQAQIAQLGGINATLQQILDQGASTIASLSAQRCPTATVAVPTTTVITTTRSTTTATHTATTTTTATGTTATGGTGSGTIPAVTTSTGFTLPTQTTPAPPASGGAGLAGSSGNPAGSSGAATGGGGG